MTEYRLTIEDIKKFKRGDYFPLVTRQGNVLYTEILEGWTYHYENGKAEVGFLFDDKAIMYLIEELEARFKCEQTTTIFRTGDERSGKSTISLIEQKAYLSPYFIDKEKYHEIITRNNWSIMDIINYRLPNMDDICFSLTELQSRIDTGIIGERRMLTEDEAAKAFFNQQWWNALLQEFYKELTTTAVMLQVIALNLPHKKDLMSKLSERKVDFWEHTFAYEEGMNLDRGYLEIRMAEKNRWDLGIYWKPYRACRFPKLIDDDWNAYYQKKIAAIARLKEERKEVSPEGKRYLTIQNQRDKAICALRYGHNGKDGFNDSQIGELIGLSGQRINEIIREYIDREKAKEDIDKLGVRHVAESEETIQ